MNARRHLPSGLAASLGIVVSAACGTSSDGGGQSNDAGSDGRGMSSGNSSSSGATSSSGGGSSSASGSSSGSGVSSGSAPSSASGGGGASSGSAPSSASGSGGSSADASIPPGIPSAGTCSTIPVLHGGDLITRLLAIAAESKCTGASVVGAHAYTKEGGAAGTTNICKLNGAVYFTSGMNIDCDGLADSCMPQHCPSNDPTNQPQTSFRDAKGQYLSAGLTPYIVIPNDFTYAGLDTNNGGNVLAVIYNDQLEFAVFGDTGPPTIIGEASFATANNLGINPSPATGGTAGPVTYIVFTGTGARPQDLSNPQETWQLGMMLAQQLIMKNP